ncbi:MAG: hypothetical protein MUE44_04845 [Oscillatoriaceae cyanobacterium Prado104]|nr:hypothetical protein [Oscillatoriaceae cyanobacterium Prado104]
MVKIILIIILIFAGVIASTIALGKYRWQLATEEARSNLEAARLPIQPLTFDAREITDLPAPVQRYFRTVLAEGQPLISTVRISHQGTFNASETEEKWSPFTSTQLVISQRPGFDWDARIAMIPGVSVLVRDAYIAGEGILHASVLGIATVAEVGGTPEAARGELMRFLAEAAWYPTRLLPSQGIEWEAIDNSSARATLKDGNTSVSLDFSFDETGAIVAVRADARPRTVNGKMVLTPWQGRFWDWEMQDGVRIPKAGEVAWEMPDGSLKPYWRARITNIVYEFAK